MSLHAIQATSILNSRFAQHRPRFQGQAKSLTLSALELPKGKPVAVMLRDKHVECVWQGSLAVANANGQIMHQIGDSPDFPIITRSSIKPIHALILADLMHKKQIPLDRIKPEEWTLLAASHSGTDENRKHLQSLLKRFDIPVETLICGQHYPLDKDAAELAIKQNRAPDNLDHQCAGHHAGQAIMARLLGAKPSDYADPNGRVQQYYLQTINSHLGGQHAKSILWDGCNIPTTAIPLAQYAGLYAKLLATPFAQELFAYAPQNSDILGRLIGHTGNIDGHLMRITQGRLLAKCGNDGVLAVIRNSNVKTGHKGEALVLKLWSGSGNQDPIRDRVAIQALSDLKWITPKETASLRQLPMFAPVEYTTQGIAKDQEKLRYLTAPLPWKRLSTSA